MSPKHRLLTGSDTIQLTEGPIARQLIAFAVPLFLGSLVQQLYSKVDLMFVGKLIGRDASAAVGSSGLMVTCIVGFFTGLSVGVGLSIAMGVSVTAVLAALGLLLGRTLFGLFSSDDAVIRLGLSIIRVTFPLYFVYVFLETFGGAGKALPTMLIIFVNMCGVRIGALKLIMAKSPVVGSVAWVYPITWICTSLCLFIYYKTDRWVPGKE